MPDIKKGLKNFLQDPQALTSLGRILSGLAGGRYGGYVGQGFGEARQQQLQQELQARQEQLKQQEFQLEQQKLIELTQHRQQEVEFRQNVEKRLMDSEREKQLNTVLDDIDKAITNKQIKNDPESVRLYARLRASHLPVEDQKNAVDQALALSSLKVPAVDKRTFWVTKEGPQLVEEGKPKPEGAHGPFEESAAVSLYKDLVSNRYQHVAGKTKEGEKFAAFNPDTGEFLDPDTGKKLLGFIPHHQPPASILIAGAQDIPSWIKAVGKREVPFNTVPEIIKGKVLQGVREAGYTIMTDAEAKEVEESEIFDTVLNQVVTLANRINVYPGIIAKAAGTANEVLARGNLADDVAEYNSLIEGYAVKLAKEDKGERFTDKDVELSRQKFPKPGDSLEVKNRKIANLRRVFGKRSSLIKQRVGLEDKSKGTEKASRISDLIRELNEAKRAPEKQKK